ncbi:MAG: pitrilysin family protein [Neisseria sp.]|nr:pitrilysin family protein [Neisseria sp.]
MKTDKRFFCAALLLAAALPAWAETVSATLPNGMKVLVKEDKRAPVVSVRLWYKVGSVDEKAGKTGLSHALEHMMFKGTPAYPSGEFNRKISAMGGSNNAYTNRTETVYTAEIAAKNLPDLLKMEADRMANLNFSDRDFDNEMKVIREERRMRTEDNPFGKLWENVNLKLWQKAANRAPVIGFMDDLHGLKADDLRAWYGKWYAPNNAMLVVVGGVDAKETVKQAEAAFGKLAAKPLPERNDELERPSEFTGGEQTVYAVTELPVINLNWRVAPQLSADDRAAAALDMLAAVLGGSDSSRYSRKLVRGEAVALGVSPDTSDFGRENATFSITAMPVAGVPLAVLQEKVLAELRDVAENGVSEEELALIRRPLENSRIFAKDSVRHQADILGALEHNGFGWQSEDEEWKTVLSVTAEEVQAAAKKLLAQPYLTTTLLPQKQKGSPNE